MLEKILDYQEKRKQKKKQMEPKKLEIYLIIFGIAIIIVLINNIFNGIAYPFAGPLGSGLRAAGDVKFTMTVSVVLTIAARLFFSALFGLWLGWGVIGVALGMSLDLVLSGWIFIRRYRSRKWTKCKLI